MIEPYLLRLFGLSWPILCKLFPGTAYLNQLKCEEALPFYQKALTMKRRLYPCHHTSIAKTLFSLAQLRARMNSHDEALDLFEECLEIRIGMHGQDHSECLKCLNRIAHELSRLDKNEDAVNVLQVVLDMTTRLNPEANPEVAKVHRRIGSLLDEIGKFAESRQHMREADRIFSNSNTEAQIGQRSQVGSSLGFFWGGLRERDDFTYLASR